MAGLLEKLTGLAKSVFTVSEALERLQKGVEEVRQEVRGLNADVRDLQVRVVRLESLRDADRSQMAAELARFMAEVERVEMRLASEPPAKRAGRSTPGTKGRLRKPSGEGGST